MNIQSQVLSNKPITLIPSSVAVRYQRKYPFLLPCYSKLLTTFNKNSCRKKSLFKFDKASASNNDTGSSVKEHKRNASDMSNDETLLLLTSSIAPKNQHKVREKSFVCDPNPSLIRILYLPLMNHIREMEELMKNTSNQGSSLRTFVSAHIKEQFLAKGHNRTLQLTIEALSKNHDAWRAIISSEEIKALGLTRPLLQSTVLFENRKSFFVSLIGLISFVRINLPEQA